MKKYYSLTPRGREASLYIYNDLLSGTDGEDGNTSAMSLASELDALEADTIHVYISSYGGEVKEGIAAYNALKRHPANVITHADGMVCSAAVLPFAAGDERVMPLSSLLLVHNAWASVRGNAAELRKEADELEVITEASKKALLGACNLSPEALQSLFDEERFLTPQEALEMGFATSIESGPVFHGPGQSARDLVFQAVRAFRPVPEEQQGHEPEKKNLFQFLSAL